MTWNLICNTGEELIYLDPIIKGVSWSGDIMQASRKIQVELSNTFYTSKYRLIQFEEGTELTLVEDDQELFRGVIFETEIDHRGQMSLTAYDENIYLTQNKDTKKEKNITASDFVKKLCSEFDIPIGTIEDTGFVIPKLILKNKSLWEMMITALTITKKQTGRSFIITSKQGKLHLLERKKQVVQWVLENGVNILSAKYSRSIMELRNQVKVMGGDEDAPTIITLKDDSLIQRYGLMQHLEEKFGKDVKKSELEQLAKQQLANLTKINDQADLDALGISAVTAGCSVYVVEKMTGIVGGYYVSTDDHRFEGKVHKMSVKLSADEELPEMEYEPPAEPEKKKNKGGGKADSKYAYLADVDLASLTK